MLTCLLALRRPVVKAKRIILIGTAELNKVDPKQTTST